MERLKQYLEQFCGLDITSLVPQGMNLFPLDITTDANQALLFGSEHSLTKKYIVTSDYMGVFYPPGFFYQAPLGYFLIGFWGHGLNSHAFYYSEITNFNRVLFRISTGGMEGNWIEDCKKIKPFLESFFEFRKDNVKKLKMIVAFEDIDGKASYVLVPKKGEPLFYSGSILFYDADFTRLWKYSEVNPQKKALLMKHGLVSDTPKSTLKSNFKQGVSKIVQVFSEFYSKNKMT
ncbi:MAG: hypothetical protein HQK77_18335 [Desulfobacterales bacterium]|nr:hypothetical protein [Desulfobacterales bacterium]